MDAREIIHEHHIQLGRRGGRRRFAGASKGERRAATLKARLALAALRARQTKAQRRAAMAKPLAALAAARAARRAARLAAAEPGQPP